MARKKRVRKSKIQTDEQGQFIWETYFVGGKQKRRKVRVIAGERVDDKPTFIFLDRTTGKFVWIESEEEAEDCSADKNLLELPEDLHEGRDYALMEDFILSLEDGPVRDKLARAIRGKGVFRRFRDTVFGSGDVELKYAWDWFETQRKREHIVDWLESCGIEPQWNRDIFEPPPLPDKRADLLKAVLQFVRDARDIPGVLRIALLGSLTTNKAVPKDIDLLVEVENDEPLRRLAKVRRQLAGKTMQTGDCCGADVFLCKPRGEYLGRVCQWKKCAAGIRQSCPAQHCGRQQFLCDDLHHVELNRALLLSPPLDLWPKWIARTELPDDLQRELAELHEPDSGL